jgi:IS66 C-terminal element
MRETLRCSEALDGQDALRIHRPAAADTTHGELSAAMTLAEFVAVYYEPVHLVMRDARPRQVEEVRQTVKCWVRFTGDPPLAAVSVYHARLWSLIASAERHGVDPQRYLTSVLAKIGQTPTEDLNQFLPDVWKRDDAADTVAG